MVAHKLDAICAGEEASQPDEEAEDADAGDEDHPEPEEHVDLLVVEVDGENALNGVRLDVAEVLPADLCQISCKVRQVGEIQSVGVIN